MKKKIRMGKKLISLLLAVVMFFTVQGESVCVEAVGTEPPANPVHHCTKENDGSDYTDWSYVYFGSYPQTEVKGAALTVAITGAGYDADGDAWVSGTKYRRISKIDTEYDYFFGESEYRYFKWEPIKWRVLRNDGTTLFVMADQGIDCKDYHEQYNSITWEGCTLRNWLNDIFYNTAFSSSEQEMVVQQDVVNENHSEYGTPGGNGTKDKIYLLSSSEALNPENGFCEDSDTYSASRRMQPSDYAHAMGVGTRNDITGGNDNCNWLLRSPGEYTNTVMYVGGGGDLGDSGRTHYDYDAVVPVLHIKISMGELPQPDEIISGRCGENVYYEFNPSTETMRIYGEGAMDDYNKTSSPWYKESYVSNIKKLKIEEGVTYIGEHAFYKNGYVESSYGCGNLTSVEIADTVTNIGDSAFSSMALSEIKWGSSLKSIGNEAFRGIDIQELNLPQSVESIGYNCFASCPSLKKSIIPDNCEIGEYAFSYCDKLESVKIGSDCKIGDYVFSLCDKLECAEIGSDCELGGHAFDECSSLSSVMIGEGSIGSGPAIFSDCASLNTILLPDSWELGENASYFRGCKNLTDINFSSANTKYKVIDHVVYSKDGSKIVCYPAGLKEPEYEILDGTVSIGNTAFEDQDYLEHIVIPDSVQEIGWRVFNSCSKLNYVIIPEGIPELKATTFAYCDSLDTILLPASLKSIIQDDKSSLSTFLNTDLIVIYAEKGTYAQEFAGDNFKQTIHCSFDADGGTVTPRKKPVIFNDRYHKLPVPVKEGYHFLGWYTADGGKITDNSIVTSQASHTLIAYWEKDLEKQIADCEIKLSSVKYTYDGKEKKPTVTVKDDLVTLSSGIDYSLTYTNNINAGTATVRITGAGNYTGTISKTFTISAKPINEATVTLEKTSYAYDGTEKQPSVVVKDDSTTLINGTDYTVSYSNNVNVGTATVTITGKGNYSGTISKTFTISAKQRSFLWNQDNWNFNNSSYQGYFSSGKYIDQINSTYLNKLKNNLTNSEYKAVFDNRLGRLHDRFGGSCYGMSSTSLLAMENYLPYSDYGSGATNLYQLRYPLASESVSSLITYYQMLQVKSVIQQQYRTVPDKSNKENIQKIITLLDENSTVLIGFKKDGWGGHAVLAYGYEYGSYTWNGISYQGCIKICDPNSSKEYNGKCNIYFNTNSYNWTIPYYSSAPITSVSGAKFNYVGADVNEINYGGYLSGTSKVNALDYVARIDAAAVSENRTVTKVSEVDGNYFPQNNAPGDIVEDYSYVLGGETAGTIGYNLYDAGAEYKLSQNNAEKLQLSIDYEDCYLEGGSAAGNNIIFDNDGYVSVSGESADYNISMTFDEDYPTDWFTIQIDGKNSNNASLEKCDLGYILSGDNLQNVEVRANNRQDSAHVRFTTKYQSAYIYEINKDTIGVKVDADKNGTYETQIPTEDTHQYGSEWRTDDKSHWKECDCGEKSELSSHIFKWVIDKNASIQESGFKHEECVVCGYRRNENTVIGKLGNTPEKGQKLTDHKSGAVYKVVIAKTKGGTVEYTKPLNNNTANISIPSTVRIDGISYKVTSIAANAFKNNKKIAKVKIGSNVTSIGKNAFSGCSKLKTLMIGNNMVSIGDNAFLNCTSIKTVTIPAKVKKIGKQAFYGCKKLKTIKISTKKLVSKNVGSKAFAKIAPKATVKVPAFCLKSYKKLLQKKGLNGKKQKIKK